MLAFSQQVNAQMFSFVAKEQNKVKTQLPADSIISDLYLEIEGLKKENEDVTNDLSNLENQFDFFVNDNGEFISLIVIAALLSLLSFAIGASLSFAEVSTVNSKINKLVKDNSLVVNED